LLKLGMQPVADLRKAFRSQSPEEACEGFAKRVFVS